MLAGFSQNFENPYWSVLSVYIIVNPPGAGAIRSKCVFRLLGTVIGGVLVVAVTGLFGDQIGILLMAPIASYIWFAVAVTGAVISIRNIMHPERIYALATARVGEISLGILMTAAVDCLWPEPMTPAFLKTMADWRSQARDFAVETIRLAEVPSSDEERQGKLRDLVKGIQAIDAKAIQLPFDIVPRAPRGRDLDLVRRQVVATVGDLIAVELRARPLRETGEITSPIDGLPKAVIVWLRDEPELCNGELDAYVDRGRDLAVELGAPREDVEEAEERVALTERGFRSRLAAFLHDWCDLLVAIRAVETGRRLPPRLESVAARAKPVRSVDYLATALDLMPLVLAMTVSSAIWYLTAWDNGPTALLFSFAGCIFLVGQAQILESTAGFLACVLIAFGLVFLYQFAVLPRVTDFPVLIMVLGCALLPLGLLMAMSMAGMLIAALTLSFLGLQNAYSADFAQSLQTLAGSLVGLLIAVISLRVCAYDHARFATRRLAAAVHRDVLDVARASRLPGRERFRFLALYRLSLYFPAAEQAAADGSGVAPQDLLSDLIVGHNLLTLRRREASGSTEARDVIKTLRDTTAATFRRKLAGRDDAGALPVRVDGAIEHPAVRADPAHAALLDALVGLQLALRVPAPLVGEVSAR